MQGFGKVAARTAEYLLEEDAQLVVTDIDEAALERARGIGLKVVAPEAIYDVECDIFSPCGMGGVLNSNTIPRLKCRVVAGGANNQLLTKADGEDLYRRGILYAPDYIINAGGAINIAAEIGMHYDLEWAREKTERIYGIMGRIIGISKQEEMPTAQVADRLAEARLKSVQAIKKIHLPRRLEDRVDGVCRVGL
jgi:leucine dehydrogenase